MRPLKSQKDNFVALTEIKSLYHEKRSSLTLFYNLYSPKILSRKT